jgi:hypothetical protein
MTLLRMQCTPTTHLWIRSKLKTWYIQYRHPTTNTAFYLESHILPLLDTFIFSPIHCGFASMLLRLLPYSDPTHLEEIRTEALWKEIHSTMGPDRAQALDYTPLFSYHTSSIHTPLNPFSTAQPLLSQSMRMEITEWKRSLQTRIILPTVGRKTLGIESSYNYWKDTPISTSFLPFMPPITPQDLERRYMETGCTSRGPVEVRMAFKFTDLKPRVYYAMGSTSYFASRYIHSIADSFQRIFPSTHPVYRYNPRRIEPLEDDDIMFIYDYTSFTSNLAELKYFLDALASFCDDTSIQLLDTHYGIVTVNLGDMLREYNTIVNVDAEFDIGPILQIGAPVILHSAKSGLLGVYGNIVWSLSLHGINLCHMCGGVDKCNCVGDDAEGKVKKSRGREGQNQLLEGVRVIGDISEEKMCWWIDDSMEPNRKGYHYVKRPIDRIDNHVWSKPMLDFPSLSLVVDCSSPYHTVPFESIIVRKRKFIVQTCRFFDSINGLFSSYLADFDIPLILVYLRWCCRKLGLPKKGVVPGGWTGSERAHYQDLAFPVIAEDSMVDWRRLLWDNFGASTCLIQIPITSDISDISGGFQEGEELFLQSSGIISLLESVGILERIRRRSELVFTTTLQYEAFCAILDGTYPVSYVYLCLRDSPFWLVHYLS